MLYIVSVVVKAEDRAHHYLFFLIHRARNVVPRFTVKRRLLEVNILDGIAEVGAVAVIERHTLNLSIDCFHDADERVTVPLHVEQVALAVVLEDRFGAEPKFDSDRVVAPRFVHCPVREVGGREPNVRKLERALGGSRLPVEVQPLALVAAAYSVPPHVSRK